MKNIEEVTIKRYCWFEVIDRIQVIIKYKSGRISDRTYMSVSDVPYTVRDFIATREAEDIREHVLPGSFYKVLETTYRGV